MFQHKVESHSSPGYMVALTGAASAGVEHDDVQTRSPVRMANGENHGSTNAPIMMSAQNAQTGGSLRQVA